MSIRILTAEEAEQFAAAMVVNEAINLLRNIYHHFPPNDVLEIVIRTIDEELPQTTQRERDFYNTVRSLCVLGTAFNDTYVRGKEMAEAAMREADDLEEKGEDEDIIESMRTIWNTRETEEGYDESPN